MKEFITAANGFKPESEDAFEFMLDGREMVIYHPNTAQLAIMMTITRGELGKEQASTFMQLFFSLFEGEDAAYLQGRLMNRRDPFDLDSEGGMLDIWEALLADVTANRPPASPTDFQPSQRATGRGSTASSRAKASTSSRSRSRASSQS